MREPGPFCRYQTLQHRPGLTGPATKGFTSLQRKLARTSSPSNLCFMSHPASRFVRADQRLGDCTSGWEGKREDEGGELAPCSDHGANPSSSQLLRPAGGPQHELRVGQELSLPLKCYSTTYATRRNLYIPTLNEREGATSCRHLCFCAEETSDFRMF